MKRILASLIVVAALAAPAQAQPHKAFAKCQRNAAHNHLVIGGRSVRDVLKAFCVNLRVTR
jgi:hypothetical protein